MPNYNPSPATRFKTERVEALSEKLTIRLAPSMLEQLKQLPNYQDFIREAIARHLQSEKPS